MYMLTINSITLARTFENQVSSYNFTSYTNNGFGVQTLKIPCLNNTKPNNIKVLKMKVVSPGISTLNTKVSMEFNIQTYNGVSLKAKESMLLSVPQTFKYIEPNDNSSICEENIYNCVVVSSNNQN
jgi:hypothetical protein